MELFALKPDQKSPEFCDMIHFISHVSKCYKDVIMPFSQSVYQLLDKHVDVLHPQVRILCSISGAEFQGRNAEY